MRNWTLNKKEIFFGGGITQFTGDLGGVNKLNSDHKISDLRWPSTSWNLIAGYRYRFHPFWSTSSRAHIGQTRGNDALKINTYQNSRNLNFRTNYLELCQRIELILFVKEKRESRYGLRNERNFYYQYSIYTGLGGLYYSPKTKYDGKWIDLQPLRTEGQGLPGGPKPYKLFTASIPVGIGFRCEISRMWRIGVETEYMFTFSDYLDDVGSVYYDQSKLASEVGELSANISNPSVQNKDWFEAGQPRGNNRLDGFFSITIQFTRNITYKDYSRERKLFKKRNYSFDDF